MTIAVTGASGFVGTALCQHLADNGYRVRALVRDSSWLPPSRDIERHLVRSIADDDTWEPQLRGCDTVVHLAARVHMMNDMAVDPLAEFLRINAEGTRNLAEQAARCGVRRVVLLSSIKVNGEATLPERPFTPDDLVEPRDAYAISKKEAELALRGVAERTGLEFVIIRPPLVYGPGVGANFAAMMRCLVRRLPLPLGSVNNNRRSLVALGNLVDLIATCVHHPNAAGRILLVSDGEDMSTAELLVRMGNALGSPARLFPLPVMLLEVGARVIGRSALADRLCNSLQIDMTQTVGELGWHPPITAEEGLHVTASHFLQSRDVTSSSLT